MSEMKPNTARFIRMLISAMIAGVIGAGGVILTAINAQGEVSRGTQTVAIITGLILAFKDVQAYLAQPPQGPGL